MRHGHLKSGEVVLIRTMEFEDIRRIEENRGFIMDLTTGLKEGYRVRNMVDGGFQAQDTLLVDRDFDGVWAGKKGRVTPDPQLRW